MAWVYILKGTSGRHYIGSTENFEQRFEAHCRGNTSTTKRLGYPLILVVRREYADKAESGRVERMLKAWKNPSKAIVYLKESSSPDFIGVG